MKVSPIDQSASMRIAGLFMLVLAAIRPMARSHGEYFRQVPSAAPAAHRALSFRRSDEAVGRGGVE